MNWSSGLSSVVFQRRRLTINVALTPPKHVPLQPGRLINLALLPKGVCTGWCLNQTTFSVSWISASETPISVSVLLCSCFIHSRQKRRAQSVSTIVFCSRALSDLPFEEWMSGSCVTHLCAIWAAGHWLSTGCWEQLCNWVTLASIHFKA